MRSPTPARLATVILALTALTGCATTQAVRPTPKPAAPEPAPVPAPVPQSEPATGILLWSVDRPGTDTARSWLYGSFHLGDPNDAGIPAAAKQAFAASDFLVTEIGDLDAAVSAMTGLVGQYAWLESGTLADHLEPKLFAVTRAALDEVGIPYISVARMKPAMVTLMLTVSRAKSMGLSEEAGVDRTIFRMMRDPSEDGPDQVLALETIEEQLQALLVMPDDLHIAVLEDTVGRDSAEAQALLMEMLTAYKAGEEAKLIALTEQPARDNPALAPYMERVLYARNRTMAERLQQMLGPRSHFVVVGAAHLVGRDSIPDLLRAAGYEVTRASPAPE